MSSVVSALHLIIEVDDLASKSLDELNQRVKAFHKRMMEVGGGLAVLGAPFIAAIQGATSAAIGFEDQIANVRKTVGATEAQMATINSAILELSKSTRTSAESLVEIATVGGQMGVEAGEIIAFTNSIDKLNVALSDEFTGGAEEVTNAFAGMRAIFQDMQTSDMSSDLLHIGNAVNILGAEGRATGPVIADFSSRIGGLTASLGMGAGDILGMSAAMQELSITAERGGSNVGRIFQKMTTDVDSFASIAGMSTQKFADLLNNDINQAFIAVLQGVNSSTDSATQMAAVIDELGLKGTGTSEVIQKLSQNTDLLAQKQATANNALLSTDSIMSEFGIKNETTAATLEKMRNQFFALGVEIGDNFKSKLDGLMLVFEPVITMFSTWVQENPELVAIIVELGAAIGAVGVVMAGIGVILPLLAAVFTPVGFTIMAIVAAVVLLYEAWTNNWGGIQEKTQAIWELIKPFFDWLGQTFLQIGEWIMTNVVPFFQVLFTEMAKFWVEIQPLLEIFFTWLSQKWTEIWAAWGPILEALMGYIKLVWDNIATSIAVVWEIIKGAIMVAWNLISGFIKAGLQIFSGDWGAAWTTIKETFSKVWETIKSTLVAVWTAITDYLSNGLESLKEIGKNLVEGLWNGISSMTGWIGEKISGFVSGITEKFKSLFGINSPSKVFAQMGRFNVAGLEAGMQSAIKNLDIPAMTASLTTGFQSSGFSPAYAMGRGYENTSNSINNSRSSAVNITGNIMIGSDMDLEAVGQYIAATVSNQIY